MRIGTLETRLNLPEDSAHITEKQIHDALWHYYYDIEKTVAYLVTTYIQRPKQARKKKEGKKVAGGFCFSF
jgi:elongation factor 1 alpha-like protein